MELEISDNHSHKMLHVTVLYFQLNADGTIFCNSSCVHKRWSILGLICKNELEAIFFLKKLVNQTGSMLRQIV